MEPNLQLLIVAISGLAVLVFGSRSLFTRDAAGPRPGARRLPAARMKSAATTFAAAPSPQSDEPGDFSLVPLGEELRQPVVDPVARSTAPATAETRIRDRYIQARFPGVMGKSEDFADTDSVVKAARLYFEDGLAMRGAELLQFATEIDPKRESLWLGRLQLCFLLRDVEAFAVAVRGMRNFHPASAHWAQVSGLGYNLGLTLDFFVKLGIPAGVPPKAGTWPELPDWLQATWDLTPEVAAAELRACLLALTNPAATPSKHKEAA